MTDTIDTRRQAIEIIWRQTADLNDLANIAAADCELPEDAHRAVTALELLTEAIDALYGITEERQ